MVCRRESLKRSALCIGALTIAIVIATGLGACSSSVAGTSNPTVLSTVLPGEGFSDQDLMDILSAGVEKEARAALDAILAANDRRFIAVLIELMRANQIGIVRGRLDLVSKRTVAGQNQRCGTAAAHQPVIVA